MKLQEKIVLDVCEVREALVSVLDKHTKDNPEVPKEFLHAVQGPALMSVVSTYIGMFAPDEVTAAKLCDSIKERVAVVYKEHHDEHNYH